MQPDRKQEAITKVLVCSVCALLSIRECGIPCIGLTLISKWGTENSLKIKPHILAKTHTGSFIAA